MVGKVRRPLDTAEAVGGYATKFKTAAETVGKLSGKIKTHGHNLRENWWGAAERMTSREIEAAGAFFTKLSTSLDEAKQALLDYKSEVERVNTELDTLQKKLDSEPLVFTPQWTVPGKPPSTQAPLGGPYVFSDPFLDPRNKAILDSLNEPANKAKTKILAAAEHVAKGTGSILRINIGQDLPFQREHPRVPGAGAVPSVLPGDVNSTTKSPGVEQLQELLLARGWRIDVTGKYDARTKQVVTMFQREKGIKPANGVVDQRTWDAIWNKPITGWN